MKKNYEKPAMEVTEFRFSEHIAASNPNPVNNCYWGSGASWSHASMGCNTNYHSGVASWMGLTG